MSKAMSKKGIIGIVLAVVLIPCCYFMFRGPSVSEWIEKVDCEYRAPFQTITYVNKQPIFIHNPAAYYIWYRVRYEDGKTGVEQQRCTQMEYQQFKESRK